MDRSWNVRRNDWYDSVAFTSHGFARAQAPVTVSLTVVETYAEGKVTHTNVQTEDVRDAGSRFAEEILDMGRI